MARMFVDAHPLALRVDVDEVREWLGAWRQAPQAAGLRARALATAMAADHLRSGHDVVIAQLYGRADHLVELETLAAERGAGYHEIVLMTDLASTLERFTRRGGPRLEEALAESGGLDSIATLHQRVESMAQSRPQATVVTSTLGDVSVTYEALINVIRHQQP